MSGARARLCGLTVAGERHFPPFSACDKRCVSYDGQWSDGHFDGHGSFIGADGSTFVRNIYRSAVMFSTFGAGM